MKVETENMPASLMGAESMTNRPISEFDCSSEDRGASIDATCPSEQLPDAGLHSILRPHLILQDPDTEAPIRVGTRNVSSLAFALDELFDVLDVLYLEPDGITPAAPRHDRLRGDKGAGIRRWELKRTNLRP